MSNELVIICGTAHPEMGARIAKHLDMDLCDVAIDRFSDGEIQIKIKENIRGTDVFIVQPTMPPADNIMEMLLLMDAVRRASCRRMTSVIPYFGYARQDRKDQPRVPIGAKLMAELIITAGAQRVLTIDLHAPQIQGFFDIPLDHLYSAPVLLAHFAAWPRENLAVVAPDVGSIKMARSFAKRLKASLAIIDKRRPCPNEAEVMNFIGDVRDRDVIIFDDMIDTAGTLCDAARECMEEQGARSVTACCTHPLFSGKALERLSASPIKEIVVSNTIPFNRFAECPKVKVLDMSHLLADAIERIHLEKTVSELFL
ncbi:phosphoribosylpyrophosphate synthetase [bacterium CG17_big_fil_post_rev_8_21_14_2_50_64_8]|nr:MAG: phosphoribosylpyrophosphate synthetase [bacterium CG17_big_fil_post_rev_8_21_14_2_50_64_8]PJA73466.1 MAG: phosphoribosylpyrophosphate synthetase [bacterium CG_4_9_14_3_um_filter_65_15]